MGTTERKVVVDANVILRYLTGEPGHQAQRALELFEAASRGKVLLFVHPAVLAEVVYVLTSPRAAGLDRKGVADVLRAFLLLPGVETGDAEHLAQALDLFASTRLDWVDCLLISFLPDHEVISFDREMLEWGAREP